MLHCPYMQSTQPRAGVPNPQTGGGPRPVADRAAQREMSGDRSPHGAITDRGYSSPPSVWPYPCVLFWFLRPPAQPTMSSNQQSRGRKELEIKMESSSKPLPCRYGDIVSQAVGRRCWERTHRLLTASALQVGVLSMGGRT